MFDKSKQSSIKKANKVSVDEAEQIKNNIVDVRKPHTSKLNQKTLKTDTIKPKKNKQPERTSQELYIENQKQKYEKLEENLDHSEDLFDEEGNFEEEESAISQTINQIKENISNILNLSLENIRIIILKITLPIKKLLIKISSSIVEIFSLVLDKILKSIKNNKSEDTEKLEEKSTEKEILIEPSFVKGTFNEILDMNIIFTNNHDIPLYKKNNSFKLSNSEENLSMITAIESIKECAQFTEGFPPISGGYYANQKINDVMSNVTEEDIKLFLGYAKIKPQLYASRTWKISETFATWLNGNSPMGME